MILKELKLVTNEKQIQNITSDELLYSILLLLVMRVFKLTYVRLN